MSQKQNQNICKIRRCDSTGDTLLAEFDTTCQVEVGQEAFDAFMEECIRQYGGSPPAWVKRQGSTEFDIFDGDFAKAEEVILQAPIVGG